MKRNKSAFTLIEIIIALVILTVGLVSILALFPVGLDAMSRAANTTKATFLAQADMEEAKRLGHGYVVAISKVQAPSPYEGFDHELTLDTTNPWTQVDAQVFWPTGVATQQSITITTFIADYKP